MVPILTAVGLTDEAAEDAALNLADAIDCLRLLRRAHTVER